MGINGTVPEKKMLYLSLAEKILSYIRDQNLQPGEKLPGERKLATEWKVSRSSLREAIRELENQGAVRVEVGKGTFITDFVRGRQVSIHLALKNFLELFEIKTVLERYILEKVTPHISEERLDILEKLARQMVLAAQEGIMPKEIDHEFHKCLLQSYSNQEMSNMVYNMIGMYETFDDELYGYCERENIDYHAILLQTFPEHLKMIQQMRKRNVEEALRNYDKIVELDFQIYTRIK